jgi:hypothetical protein
MQDDDGPGSGVVNDSRGILFEFGDANECLGQCSVHARALARRTMLTGWRQG